MPLIFLPSLGLSFKVYLLNTNFEMSSSRAIYYSMLPYFVVKLQLKLDMVQIFGKFCISLLFLFIIHSSLPIFPPSSFHLH